MSAVLGLVVVSPGGAGSVVDRQSVDVPSTPSPTGAVGEAGSDDPIGDVAAGVVRPVPVEAIPVTAPSPLPRASTSLPSSAPSPSSTPAPSSTPSPPSLPPPSTTPSPSPTTTAPGTNPPSPSAPALPDTVTIAVTGDVLPHGPVNDRAASLGDADRRDYAPLFAGVRPVLTGADLALCHLEVPIAPAGEAITTYPTFGAPAALVDGIASAGYDGCSLASNHSLDRRMAGVERTLVELERVGLGHAGTARSAAEDRGVTVYEADGVRVGHLSYAYGFNGLRLPADAPWAADLIDPARIAADARRARQVADLVVVSLHWGSEGVHEPTSAQRAVTDALLPSDDIDLVVGHHAHVVQPVEQVDGTWVLWGLGNHLSNQQRDDQRDGLLARVRFRRSAGGDWTVTGVRAVPTWVDLATHRVLPAMDGPAARRASDGLRADLAASHRRTAAVLDVDDVPGLSIVDPP